MADSVEHRQSPSRPNSYYVARTIWSGPALSIGR